MFDLRLELSDVMMWRLRDFCVIVPLEQSIGKKYKFGDIVQSFIHFQKHANFAP